MNPHERANACQMLAADKRRLGLPLDDVRRIDALLADNWGITMPLPMEQWVDRLSELAGEELAAEYWELHEEQALRYESDAPVPVQLETAFYDILADDRISGHVHSQKRTEILDAGCLLVHLVRELCISGPILDIGCHIGYHADILAQETSAAVHGIDLSAKAIEAAKAKLAGSPRLSFAVGSLEQHAQAEAYEFIYAVRSVELDKVSARQIYGALKPGGVAVILTQGEPDPSQRARRAIRDARLGWGFSDVVGGWVGDGRGYEANTVLVLVKDGSDLIPADFVEQANSVWTNYFRDYANAAETPWQEKTQAYFRGHWLASHAT
jgi:2-polyprenyl-3-methyl-5-hydroxy-6-metoxy-1,4-benzoquinol methylase